MAWTFTGGDSDYTPNPLADWMTNPQTPAPSFDASFTAPNTAGIGADIGQYYRTAMAGDPRLNAIMRNIKGTVPGDVQRQIAQAGAERGVMIGAPGSDNSNTGMLRALGLTSLDLTNKGISQYGDIYSQVPKLNPADTFISPEAQAKMNLQAFLAKQEQDAQMARLGVSESGATGRAAMNLNQENSHFGINRADTLTGVAATGAKLDEIFKRNNAWGTGGSGGGSSGDGGTGYRFGSVNSSSGSIGKSTERGLGTSYFGDAAGYDPQADYTYQTDLLSGGSEGN